MRSWVSSEKTWHADGLPLLNSKFGLAFQTATEESGAGVEHDMFDTSVVEVRQADFGNFLGRLQQRATG